MVDFVLIHGTAHGAWCWEKLIPYLTAAGHAVVAPDLPGRGADPTPPGAVTLEDYTACVCRALEGCDAPAVLVGHSFGGISISQAAERMPERIARLVYVSAVLLRDGQSRQSLHADEPPEEDTRHRVIVDAEAGTVSVRPDCAREAFYHDCSDADVAWAVARLCPEPLGPRSAPVNISAERYGRVPRAYIRCLRDRTISPRSQDAMIAALPCDPVLDMDTAHSPFLSDPAGLAAHLRALARPG